MILYTVILMNTDEHHRLNYSWRVVEEWLPEKMLHFPLFTGSWMDFRNPTLTLAWKSDHGSKSSS